MLTGSLESPFCIPLDLRIHQGLVHVGENNKTENDRETLGIRIIQMALDFSVRHDLRSIFTLDAFSPGAAVFKLADSLWSIKHQCPLLTLIIRAKKNLMNP